mmetsp:Transcript_166057/g.533014  ORF Transcript_166057/g.533014 Transcript_166057/m.533014 type:complete len:163 (-) Transcript_166057:475-963(-)
MTEESTAVALAQHALVVDELESTRARLRLHNRRMVLVISVITLIFVASLSSAVFFLLKKFIAKALTNALRGPKQRITFDVQTVQTSAQNPTQAGLRVVQRVRKRGVRRPEAKSASGGRGGRASAQLATRRSWVAGLLQRKPPPQELPKEPWWRRLGRKQSGK